MWLSGRYLFYCNQDFTWGAGREIQTFANSEGLYNQSVRRAERLRGIRQKRGNSPDRLYDGRRVAFAFGRFAGGVWIKNERPRRVCVAELE